mgnify:CR=1 FL=1|jgi:hypothetical protein
MGRPNPRHGKGRGRIKNTSRIEKPLKRKIKNDLELRVTPWYPENEEKD